MKDTLYLSLGMLVIAGYSWMTPFPWWTDGLHIVVMLVFVSIVVVVCDGV